MGVLTSTSVQIGADMCAGVHRHAIDMPQHRSPTFQDLHLLHGTGHLPVFAMIGMYKIPALVFFFVQLVGESSLLSASMS